MIIHDYKCQDCGDVSENFIVDINNIPNTSVCPECNGTAHKIISMRNTSPVDPAWIAGMLEVVDKKSDKPHVKEFIRHPTRANMHKYLKGENLRHLDPAEPAFPKINREARKKREQKQMLEMYKKRNALEVNTT